MKYTILLILLSLIIFSEATMLTLNYFTKTNLEYRQSLAKEIVDTDDFKGAVKILEKDLLKKENVKPVKVPLPLRSLTEGVLSDWIWFEGQKLVFYVDWDGNKADIPLNEIHSINYSSQMKNGYTYIDIKVNSQSIGVNYSFGEESDLDKHLNEVKRFVNETLDYINFIKSMN